MAFHKASSLFGVVFLVSPSMLCLAYPGFDLGWTEPSPEPVQGAYIGLFPGFYDFTCPQVDAVVMSVLEKAVTDDPRVAASLLRLHFHDCFVQGCDASVLLDDSETIASEKRALPNANSLRGFDVIDEIKAAVEQVCPEIVSCADILALAARASVLLSGGPSWELGLGRGDSKTANLKAANSTSLPAPSFNIQQLITTFQNLGLDESDLVALSGGHTIGMARCLSFKKRLYSSSNGNTNTNQPADLSLERAYYTELKSVCSPSTHSDNVIAPLDYASPRSFDNTYFKLILGGRGLLSSDEALLTGNVPNVVSLVKAYASNQGLFFDHFARSMVKMGNIGPLLGSNGEVRKSCRRVNF